jgi:hypothetical protein
MDSLEFIDFVKRKTLVAMFSDDELMERLVLKGGNALDLVYGISTRASVDLDFSLDGEFSGIDELRAKVERVLLATFADHDLVAFDIRVTNRPPQLSDDVRDFWGGYRVEFKLIDRKGFKQFAGNLEALQRNSKAVGPRGSTKFQIDISRHEYCESKQPQVFEHFTIFVYTPEMIVAEKLRALCQQMPEYGPVVKRTRPGGARARDFVDIHVVCSRFPIDFGSDAVHELVRRTFAVKQVPATLLASLSEHREFHRQDFESVIATVKPGFALRDFDFYFDHVLGICRDLQPLWDV